MLGIMDHTFVDFSAIVQKYLLFVNNLLIFVRLTLLKRHPTHKPHSKQVLLLCST